MELYVYDYGRKGAYTIRRRLMKGYLDTRSVRLPTVTIRSGAVSQSREMI